MLPAALRLYHSGDVDLITLLRAMTSRPAEILGLETGRLAVGAPADFILIDLDYPWQVKEAGFAPFRNTAFERPFARWWRLRCRRTGVQPRGGRRMRMEPVAMAIALGYLLGSIPFGLLLTRAIGVDIRSIGSGNIGATNVLRTGNKPIAAATLLLDASKGAAAVLIARMMWGEEMAMVAGLAAFVGHIFRSGSTFEAAKVSRPISVCFWLSTGWSG